jgi:hypothetical protein
MQNIIIENDGLNCLKIGDNIVQIKKTFPGCKIKKVEGLTIVYYKKEAIMSIRYEDNHKLDGMELYSKMFMTKEGIKVGMKTDDLLKIIGRQKLTISEGGDYVIEYFSPLQKQTKIDDKHKIEFIITIVNKNNQLVGKYPKHYPEESVSTDEYDKSNSYVRSIQIYKELVTK